MENPLRNKIQELLHQDKSYVVDKNYVLNLINDVISNKIEIRELEDRILHHSLLYHWSRRKLSALLFEILVEARRNSIYSDEIFDSLNNLFDSIEGNVSWRNIVRLNLDPEDQKELSDYVRSENGWIRSFILHKKICSVQNYNPS